MLNDIINKYIFNILTLSVLMLPRNINVIHIYSVLNKMDWKYYYPYISPYDRVIEV